MDTNKILSADFLDLLFDNRNKDYGAYYLRKTYHTRITRSLIFTGVFTSLIFAGVVLANKEKRKEQVFHIVEGVTISTIEPKTKIPEPLPEPHRQEPPQVKTEQFLNIQVTPDDQVVDSPPSQQDLTNAKIADITQDGADFVGIVEPQILDEKKEIIEEQVKNDEPLEFVHVEASFDGNWQKFLLKNLNPQTPIDNEAPSGNYTVLIQFVVDIDGTVSDIKALTNLGYGLEQEAIRVLKKAAKWKPAIQDGRQVKAYRKQAITFQVTTED